ncbi:MAG: hypothetical protein JW810_07320 [Sedimentisphaerales bacterium]|nr:hypothetical protein [Sedimentisphaerales bacterium]
MVLVIMALLVTMLTVRMVDRLPRVRLDRDVQRFVHTLRATAEEAVRRSQTFAVVIDVYDGYYTVYEVDEKDQIDQNVEPFIEQQALDECWIDEMEFEDGSHQYSGQVILRATAEGWSGSLLFRLIDREDRQRYVRCDRFTTRVIADRHPLELLEAKSQIAM